MSPGLLSAAQGLLSLAGTVHGGSLAAFALLLIGRRAIPHVDDVALVRVYRAWGGGIGLSLGAFWLALGVVWPAVHNPGAAALLDMYAVPSGAAAVQLGLLGVYWVNYVALEIWTLEPCRLLDRDGVVSDPAAYADTTRRVARHLALNAVLFNAALLVGAP